MSYRENDAHLDTSTDPPIGAGRRWYGILRARMFWETVTVTWRT